MILAPRKHLFATNIFVFFVIFIIQKCIRIFCIIEEKACKNSNCPENKRCDERCIVGNDVQPSPDGSSLSSANSSSSSSLSSLSDSTPPSSPTPPAIGLRLIPAAMRQKMQYFGFGEGYYQIFVEEKQRQQYVSKSRLNAAVAEVKLNPN